MCGGPINDPGDVFIDHSGDCTISGGVTAVGNIYISTTGNLTIAGDVLAGGTIFLQAATGGDLTVGGITASGGYIEAYCDGVLTTGDLDASNGILLGGTDISVNGSIAVSTEITMNASGSVFVSGPINSSGEDNSITLFTLGTIELAGSITAPGYGVSLRSDDTISTQSINTDSSTSSGTDIRIIACQGGGSAPFVIGAGGTNGVSGTLTATRTTGRGGVMIENGGTGGIEVDGSAINIQPSGAQAKGLILKSVEGPVTVTGHLSVDGSSGQSAGQLIIMADTVVTTGGAQITANHSVASNANHYVVIAASSITYTGGLTLSVNGNTNAGLYLLPLNSQSVEIPFEPWIPVIPDAQDPQRDALTLHSTDGGTLTMNVSGPDNRVTLIAYPLTFSGGPVNINADRSNVYMQYVGSPANNDSLVFSGGTVNVNADSTTSAAAGTISIYADKIATPTPAVTLTANGGTNGGAIIVQSAYGTIPVGVGTGKIKINANGGSGSGNGGEVTVNAPTVTIADSSSSGTGLLAKATATNGNGGKVSVNATTLTFSGTDSVINVDGAGSGNGGEILINTSTGVTVDQGTSGNVALLAKSAGSGNGGKITLTTGGKQTIDGAHIDINAGTSSGNGNGGQLLSTSYSDTEISGDIDCSGHGSGHGGTIEISCMYWLDLDSATLTADGGATGDGGSIQVQVLNDVADIDSAVLSVSPGTDGNGGSISIHSLGNMTLSGSFNASGDGGGNGGSITISTDAALDMSAATLHADGGDDAGDGGTITISSDTEVDLSTITTEVISAKGGETTGLGGVVIIDKVSALDVNTVIKVNPGALLGTSDFAGSIKLNDILCQQWMTGYGEWPYSYWASINPTSPSTSSENVIPAASFALPASIRGDLETAEVQIYGMDSIVTFFTFFNSGTSTKATLGYSDEPKKASAAFKTVLGDGGNFTPVFAGSIQHELGHQWDAVRGNPAVNNTNYLTALAADIYYYNNGLACAVAVDGVFAPAAHGYCTTYMGHDNWVIIGPGDSKAIDTGNDECFARAFAYEAGGAQPSYIANIQALMANQITYMHNVFITGNP